MIRANTGKTYYVRDLREGLLKIAEESLREDKEYSGFIIGFEKDGKIRPISIIYEAERSINITGKYLENLIRTVNKKLREIKSSKPLLLIFFRTHFLLPEPSIRDIESLRRFYEEGSKPEYNKGTYEPAPFGIIIETVYKYLVLFDMNGNYTVHVMSKS